jgi:hypothetical protein
MELESLSVQPNSQGFPHSKHILMLLVGEPLAGLWIMTFKFHKGRKHIEKKYILIIMIIVKKGSKKFKN